LSQFIVVDCWCLFLVSMGAPMCKKQAGEEPKVEVTDLNWSVVNLVKSINIPIFLTSHLLCLSVPFKQTFF